MIADIEKETQSRMQQAMDHAHEDLSAIRIGRTHPAMFNQLDTDYYEAPTPLQQLVTFNSSDPRIMSITPFDRSAVAAIEKIIRRADLEVDPSDDRNSIRTVTSRLTERRRKEYVRLARAEAEDARIAVRNIHRHSIDALKKPKEKSETNEDELVRARKTMNVTTREYVETIDELFKNKEAELNEV